ncbi:thioredoxin family protein [soil metagenome]
MQSHPEPLPIGASAPDFDLPATDGSRLALRDISDEVFVYVQGCNHCPMVHAYLERLQETAHTYAPRGVRFVMVNSNDAVGHPDDDFEAMRRFADDHHLAFTYLWDEDQAVAKAYRTFRTPEVLVFDGDRRLRYHGRIDDAPKDPDGVSSHDLRDALDTLLAGGEVERSETWAVGCTVKWKPENVPVIG